MSKLRSQDYRIITGFLLLTAMLSLSMAFSDTQSINQRCSGKMYSDSGGSGPYSYLVGEKCDGTWIYDTVPLSPDYYLNIHRWVMVAGLGIGLTCYLGYRTRVLGWYYGLLGQVFNPAIGIPFTRPEWVLMYEIALVSFVILLGFLLVAAPKPQSG